MTGKLAGAIVAAVLASSSVVAQERCNVLSEQMAITLSQYVSQKLKLGFEVRPDSDLLVTGSCYRRIVFRGQSDRNRTFSAAFFLSPDQKFLSRDLFDISVDPSLAEARDNEALIRQLTAATPTSSGPANAAVNVVVFADFQCPYCKQTWLMLKNTVLPANPGLIRVIFRQFPLAIHDWSHPAAEAAACASLQGNESFWAVYDYLFEHQAQLNSTNITDSVRSGLASKRLLDTAAFDRCLKQQLFRTQMDADLELANKYGIQGTPTLFVNSVRINGSASAEQVLTIIRQMEDANVKKMAPQ